MCPFKGYLLLVVPVSSIRHDPYDQSDDPQDHSQDGQQNGLPPTLSEYRSRRDERQEQAHEDETGLRVGSAVVGHYFCLPSRILGLQTVCVRVHPQFSQKRFVDN